MATNGTQAMQLELRIGDERIQMVQADSTKGKPLPVSRLPVKGLMRIDEVAEYLSISCNQVRNLIDQGDLEAVLVNSNPDDLERKHVRVVTESVKKFLENKSRKVT